MNMITKTDSYYSKLFIHNTTTISFATTTTTTKISPWSQSQEKENYSFRELKY